MPKREERRPDLEEESRRYREQAQRQVTASAWDRCPMKQYVRRYGWLQVVQKYAERRRNDGVSGPLKYLTIPGPNASDIGLLWRAGLLTRTDNGFPYVAICDKTSANQVVTNLGEFLAVSSRWLHDALRPPKGELVRHFPFDVINVDLCGAVITRHAERHRALRRLFGIRRLFQLQLGQGFLLLLTTSTDDELARRHLEGVVFANFDEDRFRDVYAGRYGALDLTPFQDHYRLLVRLVLPKVIGKMARDRGYRLVEHFVAKYDRVADHDGSRHKFLSHSFELEPLGKVKPSKKYEPRFKLKDTAWDELSEELSNRVRTQAHIAYGDFLPTVVDSDPTDVPAILAADPTLEVELRSEAESLIGWWRSAEVD